MIKSLLLIPSLFLLSLYANTYERDINSSKSQTTPIFRVQIGAFIDYHNAKKLQKLSPYTSYILNIEDYFKVYIGTYHDRNKADKVLHEVRKFYHDAYLSIIFEKELKVSKEEDYFKQAQAYFSTGDYESALALFDKEMILHPNNHLAALEYARTLYMLGFYKQSREAFLQVLAVNPPTKVQRNIQIFLDKIEEKLRINNFYGTIMIGTTYDDNLGYTTSSPTLLYGGLTLENDTNKTKGIYSTLNLLLSHHYEKENFSWENSFYTYNEFQQKSTISALHLLHLSTAITQSYNHFKITLPAGVSQTWFAQERDNLSIFTQPTFIYQTSKKTQIALQTIYQHTKNETDDEKSYQTWGGRVIVGKLFKRSSIHTKLGYEKDKKEEGERVDISKENYYAGATINYSFLTYSQLFLRYLYEESHYSDIDPALAYAREDKKDQLSLGLRQGIRKNSALSFTYTYLNNSSNINSYSYEKNAYSLSYSHDF